MHKYDALTQPQSLMKTADVAPKDTLQMKARPSKECRHLRTPSGLCALCGHQE